MTLKEDIVSILFVIYRVPGEFAIGAIIAFALWQTTKELTMGSIMFFLLGIFLIFLEMLVPILAGVRIYKKIFKK